MTRTFPGYVRGAIVALGSASLAGCMYFTPATGICLTQSCRDFDKERTANAALAQTAANQTPEPPNIIEAADFKLITSGAWRIALKPTGKLDAQGQPEGEPRLDDSDPNGGLTFRVAYRRAIQAAEGLVVSEGISVETFNRGFSGDPQKDLADLADATRQSMSTLFGAEPKVEEVESTLGNKPGRLINMVGPAALPAAAPGAPGAPSAAPVAAPAIRALGRCAMHRGRGYVVVVRTLDSLYERAAAVYDGLFIGFEFIDADPVYPLPSALPSGAPSGGPSALPSALPAGVASAGPSAAPSGTPSAEPSAAPAGTPLPSPAT